MQAPGDQRKVLLNHASCIPGVGVIRAPFFVFRGLCVYQSAYAQRFCVSILLGDRGFRPLWAYKERFENSNGAKYNILCNSYPRFRNGLLNEKRNTGPLAKGVIIRHIFWGVPQDMMAVPQPHSLQHVLSFPFASSEQGGDHKRWRPLLLYRFEAIATSSKNVTPRMKTIGFGDQPEAIATCPPCFFGTSAAQPLFCGSGVI